MALPGLVRVTTVAAIIGIDRRTALAWLAGKTVRRPQTRAKGDGWHYCTVEDAVALVDHCLPRLVQRRANRRARARLTRDARLTAASGPLVTYRGTV